MLQIETIVEDERWNKSVPKQTYPEEVLELAMQYLKSMPNFIGHNGEICVLLADDKVLQDLNFQFRNKNYPTNVLSFTMQHLDVQQYFVGNIAISYDQVYNECSGGAISFVEHFTHLIIHGLLHLLGYDHETESEAAVMEDLERHILWHCFKISDPYRLS